MELEVPFWTEPEDVHVAITADAVSVQVRQHVALKRTYWRDRCL